jgi:ribosomal protein L17
MAAFIERRQLMDTYQSERATEVATIIDEIAELLTELQNSYTRLQREECREDDTFWRASWLERVFKHGTEQ